MKYWEIVGKPAIATAIRWQQHFKSAGGNLTIMKWNNKLWNLMKISNIMNVLKEMWHSKMESIKGQNLEAYPARLRKLGGVFISNEPFWG